MSFEPKSDDFIFLPLGGAGEIGMNLNLYHWKGKWLMVDCGVSFGDETTPGVDVYMADPAFIEERRNKLAGLVITHAHEDHLGAVQYLWHKFRCPVYATPFAASVLRAKLRDGSGLAGEVDINVMPLGSRFDVGPFDVELVSLTHSIPEPNAVAIRTPAGMVLHTGDWKFDPDPLIGDVADEQRLRELGDEGVLALVGDSTNVFNPGTSGSEAEVRKNLTKLIGQLSGRVAVACFATNVARVESVAKAAEANGRRVALVGRSLWRIEKAARENGYLKGVPDFLTEHDAGYLPDEEVLMICTGSQGEPRAALSRIAGNNHPHVSLGRGDTVIFSSRVIPGNETAIGRVQNALVKQGVQLITADDGHMIHVSGHPARDELTRMYQLVRPKVAIPVHGEARHLEAHAALAEQCQVPQSLIIENGAMVRLADDGAEVVDHVEVGRLAVDGVRLVRLDSEVLRARHRMIHNGSAVVTVVIDRMGKLTCDPQLTALGILDSEHEADEFDAVVDAVRDAIEELPHRARLDDAVVKETARLAVRRHLKDSHGKKPLTDVHLVRI